jgi:hypothetical protein
MTLSVLYFGDVGLLTEFVNANSISSDNIQKIVPWNGQWYLFYWA